MSEPRARISRLAPGVWVVERPGRSPLGAPDFPGALDALRRALEQDAWWKRQDPLAERYTPKPSPRPWRRRWLS